MQIDTQGFSEKPFKFNGNAWEYFGIWVVNITLTVLTLGIYSAWAKVRTQQYFYGNTQLDHSAFQYLATPIQILKGRLVAVLVFGFYYTLNAINPLWGLLLTALIMLLIPIIIVMSMSFRMRNTAYRNITFRFQKNYKQAYLVYVAPVLVLIAIIVSAILMTNNLESPSAESETSLPFSIAAMILISPFLYPLWEYLKTRFLVTNTLFGTSPFNFEANAINFYKVYLAATMLLILVVALISALLASLDMSSLQNTDNFSEAMSTLGGSAVMLSSIVIGVYLWLFAYIQTKKTNMIFSNISLNNMPLESQLSVTYMFFLYISNTVAIIVSVGLLIPWTMIRTARYRANTLTLLSDKDLNHFVASQQIEQNAMGEEFGDIFDIDIGL